MCAHASGFYRVALCHAPARTRGSSELEAHRAACSRAVAARLVGWGCAAGLRQIGSDRIDRGWAHRRRFPCLPQERENHNEKRIELQKTKEKDVLMKAKNRQSAIALLRGPVEHKETMVPPPPPPPFA